MREIPMWRDREAGGCALSIETQAFCNHLCGQCPRNLDPTRSRWHRDGSPIMDKMPTKMVERLIDEAAEMGWRGPIHFSHYSEPLVDDRFIHFCKYALAKGLKPELYTNGSLLTPELIRELNPILPYVVISFNSPGSQRYWNSRFNGPRVKVDSAYQVLIWNPNTEQLNAAIARAKGTPCTGPPLIAFRINYDGQMSMCYADFNNEFGLLNATDHSLEDLWFGEEHTRAVKEMAIPGSRAKRKLCSVCPQVFPSEGTYIKVEHKAPVPPEGWWKYF